MPHTVDNFRSLEPEILQAFDTHCDSYKLEARFWKDCCGRPDQRFLFAGVLAHPDWKRLPCPPSSHLPYPQSPSKETDAITSGSCNARTNTVYTVGICRSKNALQSLSSSAPRVGRHKFLKSRRSKQNGEPTHPNKSYWILRAPTRDTSLEHHALSFF